MGKDRIKWIDVLKFVGIFCIYLGHFAKSAGNAYLYVFSFHVPLFFFLAGCTETMNKETLTHKRIIKKIKTLLIPFLFFAFISLLANLIITNGGLGSVYQSIKMILNGCIRNKFYAGSLWFLSCLFVVSLIFELLLKLKYKAVQILMVVFVFAISFSGSPFRIVNPPKLFFNVDSAIYYFIYYYLGYISFEKINKLLTHKSNINTIIIIVSGSLSFIYSALLFFGKNIYVPLYSIPYIKIIATTFSALTSIWFFVILAYCLQNVKIFNTIGQNTLYLCGSEYIIKQVIQTLIGLIGLKLSFPNPLSTYIYTFILLLIVVKFLAPVEKQCIALINKHLEQLLQKNNFRKRL